MRRFLIFFSLIFWSFFSLAQEAAESDPLEYSLSTPYSTIYTHLSYLQDDNYHPDIAAKTFNPQFVDSKEAESLAIKLKQVLDGNAIFIDLDEVPHKANYTDSLTNKHRYYLTKKYPELYVEKEGDNWYFSKKAVRNISKWHDEVYPFGTDKLLELLPSLGTKKILGLYIWQMLGILILIFMAFVLHKLFTFLIEKLILQLLFKFGYKKLADEVVIPVAKPISFLVIFPLLILLVPVLQLPIAMSKYVILALRAIWPIFAIVFLYKMVDIICIYLGKLADKTESTLDDQLVPLLRKVLKTFVVIVGALFILDNLEFDITGLIAGLSIGGLAFALAAQDTIKNFFGSLLIFVDRPFQVGDWITSGNVDGTVEEVGFRSTRIRTFRNSVMYIPNGIITNQMIDNHGLRVYRRFNTNIALTYDTPPELIEVFVEGLKEIVKKHPETRKDYFEIHFNDMADSSLNIMFYIFFKVPSWSDELRARHEVLLEIVRLAEALGVNFAFPTQTLHVETFPEKKGNSPEYTNASSELKTKLEDYLKKSNN
ncbi:mechanosensitive ion channel family protein [Fulvivirga sediminis]|uniref:Mechanosensitive ion channel family protein n=1 Tax=Fulvivirga sediminis TaxID=2803949 RepID=A0A937FD38_9BACT|nr:mechanosensitive ion channel family protein [Fulvivirga sediminis]MBL3658564.1 mechanosensitive ion channel family protein [Fulvivirga sediminis]